MVRNDKAFTFLELTVVIFLIGLMLALTIPRFRHGLLSDDLKATTRRMMGTIRTLRSDAVRDQKGYRLHFDLESNQIWVEWDAMTSEQRDAVRQCASKLPAGISILDVHSSGAGKQDVGDAKIHFTKQGYVEEAVIHIGSDDGRAHSIMLSPFLSKIKTYDTYVERDSM